METGLLVQYTVIALAVVLSAAYVARRQFPAAVRRLRVALAVPMVREGQPRWLQRLGRTIAPPSNGAAGSCGGCNGCGPTV
ncbi:DUF6587 family protein [Novilysobacter erysipheiresistens]|uniref:DUF6587 family protein n=1 Tax=Novilysobacter erysipheiresistens TaxID=1749332 RepID=A0ABU7YW77_9GAMM